MGILSKLVNSQKIIDASIQGIDASFFTKEEKSQAGAKIMEAHSEFVKSSLSGSTVSSITRRYIAVSIMAVFLLLVLFAVGIYFFDPDHAKFIIGILKDELSSLVLMVSGFYFGSYLISNHLLKGIGQVREKGKSKS
jgi:hypothetical protein